MSLERLATAGKCIILSSFLTFYCSNQSLYSFFNSYFLNQACAGQRPAHAWFLRIASVHECLYACVFVYPPPRLLITSGMMWCDIDPIRLVK